MQKPSGEVVTQPDAKAAALRSHWVEVFRARGINISKLDQWTAEDIGTRPLSDTVPLRPSTFRVTRRHIRRAILTAKNSSPGPDGIPFQAWRCVVGLS
eukprot:7317999-Pyramimonas_sp.AAC.1